MYRIMQEKKKRNSKREKIKNKKTRVENRVKSWKILVGPRYYSEGRNYYLMGSARAILIKEPETEQMDQTNAIHGKEAGKRKCE